MSVSAKLRVLQNCHYRPARVIPGRTRCHGAKSFGSVQSCCCIKQKVEPECNSGVSSQRGMYGEQKNIANDVIENLDSSLGFTETLVLFFSWRTQTKTGEQLPHLVFLSFFQRIPPI